MADLYQFSMLVSDVAPDVVEIDGRIFLDRDRCGPTVMEQKVRTYPSAHEAQKWLNLAPIDDLLDLVTDDWSMDDPAINGIADVYRRAWVAIATHALGRRVRLDVDVLRDEETGDLCLLMSQQD